MKTSTRWLIIALLCLLLLAQVGVASATSDSTDNDGDKESKAKNSVKRKKKSKDWNKVDMQKLEKHWEDGDDEEELEHEYERDKKIAAKKAKDKGSAFNPNDPESVQRFLKQNKKGANLASADSGPTMIFIELKPTQSSGEAWTKVLSLLCIEYCT